MSSLTVFIHVHVRILLTTLLIVHNNLDSLNVTFEQWISLHLSPCMSLHLFPLVRVKMTVNIGSCRWKYPLGIPCHGSI